MTAACQASLSLIIAWSLPKFMSIASVMPFSHLNLLHPLFLLPSKFPSIRDFSNKSAFHIRWPKYWSFSYSISPSNRDSGLIFLKIDWLGLIYVQATLRSLLQHHSLKTSVLQGSVLFMVQLSQLYMTSGETIASTIWTLLGRVMSLLFNTQYGFVMVFLPRSNCLLISGLHSPSAVIFRAQEEDICHYFHIFPSYLPWSLLAATDHTEACPWGATPHPRSGVATRAPGFDSTGAATKRSFPTSKELLLWGAGGLRRATPRSRSGGAGGRIYPLSKVRSSGCTLLEQQWRDTPRRR